MEAPTGAPLKPNRNLASHSYRRGKKSSKVEFLPKRCPFGCRVEYVRFTLPQIRIMERLTEANNYSSANAYRGKLVFGLYGKACPKVSKPESRCSNGRLFSRHACMYSCMYSIYVLFTSMIWIYLCINRMCYIDVLCTL